MQIFIEKENKYLNIKFKGTVKQLLKKLSINQETVIIAKNNEIVTEEVMLKDIDDVKILSVISGG